MPAVLAERLRSVPLFRTLPAGRISELAGALAAKAFVAGDVIFRQGDAADALYLVDDGQVGVSRSGETIAVLGAGSFVGEMGLLLDEVRSADLVAITDVRVSTLSKAAVEHVLENHPEVAVELSRHLSSRLAATTDRVAPLTTATVTAVWGTARLDPFLDELTDVLGRVPRVVPDGEPLPQDGDAHLVAVLPGESGRAARAILRRASHIVCFRPPPEWVTKRHESAQVLRCDGFLGLERAARFAAGRSVGVAFSSGGSKTVAHIGVVDVLREQEIPIDVVAGTSGGALVALAVGAGHGAETMTAHLRELSDLLTFRKWDVNVPPRTGVIKGKRLRDAMDRWFEGRTFADLTIPTVVLATDLATGEEIVIDEGPLADAARASLSIPGIFDPWTVNGRPVIDGAVVAPLPVNALRDRGAATVIASNVAGKAVLDDPDPDLERNPGIVQTTMRMINLMEREMLKAQLPLADVVIRPVVEASYSFDFTRIDDFVAEGRRAATEAVDLLRRQGNVLIT